MCDILMRTRYGKSYYICPSCYEELLAHREKWPVRMTLSEVNKAVDDFMASNIGQFSGSLSQSEIDKEFQRILEVMGRDHDVGRVGLQF